MIRLSYGRSTKIGALMTNDAPLKEMVKGLFVRRAGALHSSTCNLDSISGGFQGGVGKITGVLIILLDWNGVQVAYPLN